jgi:hypothetical protein
MGHRSGTAWLLPALLASLLTACGWGDRPGEDRQLPGGATPVDAVRELNAHLVSGDFAAFARDAVPPELHVRLDTAWREGRTRWPLDELPLSDTHPRALAALTADDAEASLQNTFDRQFANAAAELRQTATALGLFAVQFIQQHGEYSDAEREHFSQVIAALSAWAAEAPLNDRKRAAQAIALLTVAARQARLDSAEDFAAAGIDEGLHRLVPVVTAGKRAMKLYGLDLDADIAAMHVTLQSQTGDTAKLRLQYTLAGMPIDTVIDVERRERRWYVSDFVANAEAAVGADPNEEQSIL